MLHVGNYSEVEHDEDFILECDRLFIKVNYRGRRPEVVYDNIKKGIALEFLLRKNFGFSPSPVEYLYDLTHFGTKYEVKTGMFHDWWVTYSPMSFAKKQSFDRILLGTTNQENDYYVVFSVPKALFFSNFSRSKYNPKQFYFNHKKANVQQIRTVQDMYIGC